MASLVEVSRAEFFARINPLNVHPHPRDPEFTDWEMPNRCLIGRTYPGWKNPGAPKRYLLMKDALL